MRKDSTPLWQHDLEGDRHDDKHMTAPGVESVVIQTPCDGTSTPSMAFPWSRHNNDRVFHPENIDRILVTVEILLLLLV